MKQPHQLQKTRGPLARGHRQYQPTLVAVSGNSQLLVDFGADGINQLIAKAFKPSCWQLESERAWTGGSGPH